MNFADVVRFVLIALACLVTGSVATVMRLHYKAWRAAPRDLGLLPLHVATISAAHMCFVVGTALGMIDQLGSPQLTWRLGLYITGCLLTLFALYVIAQFSRRRVSSQRTSAVVVVETEKVENHDAAPPIEQEQ